MDNLKKAKQEVLKGCRLTLEKDFTVGTAGNISARVIGEDKFVITPSAMDYNTLTEDDLVVIDMEGNVVDGKWKPSIEHNLHRYILMNRPDVNAVVHVHSTFATAYASIEGVESMASLDIEAANYLGGDLKIAAFAPPGSDPLAEYVRDGLGQLAGVLMSNHGSCCVGGDMHMAITVCEIVEKTCYSLFLIQSVGKPHHLPQEYKDGSFDRYCKFHREAKV